MPDRPLTPARALLDGPIAVVGAGRVGTAIAAALRAAGAEVQGPLGRGATASDAAIVLLAVPDAEIRGAAAAVATGATVGHFSGATSLEPLAPHEAFSIHPLLAITGPETSFSGVPAAIAGSTPHALTTAEALATTLGMHPFRVAEADRAAYHAAASIASNFLVTLEAFAEDLAATAGVDREVLMPLVLATVQNWSDHGPARALTGPIARGDNDTVARQRAAVAERLPERVALFDVLTDATRALAGRREVAS